MATNKTAFGKTDDAPFPGSILRPGAKNTEAIMLVQQRLNALGCGPVEENGIYDKARTGSAVRLFQSRFPDVTGLPLEIDGEVGSLTWGTLFGAATVPSQSEAPSDLIAEVLKFAANQIGVREAPLGSNRGPQVDKYLEAVGLDPTQGSFAWCVAFTYFCYKTGAERLAVEIPHVKTAGVLDHWNRASSKFKITSSRAIANPSLVRPGALFIIDLGEGSGHSGIVVEAKDGRLITIEGNTNDNGSRNGIGVFQREARKIAQINKGFIDYGPPAS